MGMLRLDEVRRRVGLSRSTIWRLEREGQFVLRRRLSVHAVGWPEDEIEDWLRTRGPACASGDLAKGRSGIQNASPATPPVRRTRRGRG